MRSRNVLLGPHKWTGEPVHFPTIGKFGVTIIGAISRYGKSTLVKNTYTQIGKRRKIIILDYEGEHTQSKYPNLRSKNLISGFLPGMHEYRNVRFKISQYKKLTDWISMGFSLKAAQLVHLLAQHTTAHMDDPEAFKVLLAKVPEHPGEEVRFEKEYGIELPSSHGAVVQSAKSQYAYLKSQGFFAEQQEPTYDFGVIAQEHDHININMGLNRTEYQKGRAYAGKILEQIMRRIDHINPRPLFVIEEADLLAPNEEPEKGVQYSSTEILIEMTIKQQRKNIELLYIVQDLDRLHSTITGNFHTLIIGHLPEHNRRAVTNKLLYWDIEKNYREFYLERKGKPGYSVFVPFESLTRLPHQSAGLNKSTHGVLV